MAAHSRASIVKIDLPGGQEFLVLQIDLDCPACGQQSIRIIGHHLRMVRDAILHAIDLYPDPQLTGDDPKIAESLQFNLQGSTRPEDN